MEKPTEIQALEKQLGFVLKETQSKNFIDLKTKNLYLKNVNNEIIGLSLRNNKLIEVPNLAGFEKLEFLNLHNNQITEIKGLDQLKGLITLDLSFNQITEIKGLEELKELTTLDLSFNQITEIKGLEELINLKELDLDKNKIIDLTPLYFSLKYNKIKKISIYNNPNLLYPNEDITSKGIEYIIAWFDDIIFRCNQKIKNADRKLDLGMMGLTDLNLIPDLFKLENLEELILSNVWAEFDHNYNEWNSIPSQNDFYKNNIYNIPDEIKKLKKLKKLIIGGDWKKGNQWNRWRINDCSFINKLDKIEFVNLSNNSIETFKITKELNHLKTIHINNNNIKSISLSRARNLEYLFASNNQIENLNFLVKSTSLKALDLHSNNIKNLSPIKILIEKIGIINGQWEYDTISIAKNNLENPGIEVIDRGKEEVIKMMKINYGTKTFKNNELKLILVGNSETGKTTLAKYLAKDPKYKGKHPFTLWMDILKINYGNVKINVFDFGGHEYFHDTHHIFFSKNSLYFLLWNKSTDEYKIRELNQIDENKNPIKLQTIDYPLSYWIDSINHFIKEKSSDNFSDEMKEILNYNENKKYKSSTLIIQNKVNNRGDIKFLNQFDLLKDYSFIYNYINLDFHNEKNLNLLNENLNEMINEIGTISGGKYPIYYQKIKENIEKFKNYLNKKIITFNEFKRLCQGFKRELTLDEEYIRIAFFLNDIGLILMSNDKSVFYLDLNFVSHQIIKIYNGLQNTNGLISESNVKKKNIEEYKNIIKLILDYNLAFELNKNDEKNYIFPLYLPKEPSKLVKLLLRENLKIYKRIYYTGFMHKGIILHVFSEYSNRIVTEEIDKNTYFWKNGLIVKENNDLVLIKFFEGDESNNAYIDLYNFGNNEIFVKKINNKIIELNNKNNYNVEEYVSYDGNNFIPLKLINENEEKNSIIIYKEKKYNLNNFTKYFKNQQLMKKVFISYSKFDDDYKKEFVKHLITLKDENLIDPFNCDEIDLGENSHEIIQKKLLECDYMFALVSIDYLNTDYIRNFEVNIAEELGKKIIPIVIKPCDWETSKLGKYHATLRGKNISLDNDLFLKDIIKEATSIERAAWWTKIIKELRQKLFKK